MYIICVYIHIYLTNSKLSHTKIADVICQLRFNKRILMFRLNRCGKFEFYCFLVSKQSFQL